MSRYPTPHSSYVPGPPATQLYFQNPADGVILQASPDELVDLSNMPGYADSDTYAREVYLLYEVRKGANNAPGGPRWMIGWPIYTDPHSDVWRLLFSVPVLDNTRTVDGMTAMTVTRPFKFVPERRPSDGWHCLSVGTTTLEQRRAIEKIAAIVGTKDRKKEALMNSAQWVECVLTQVERNGVLDRNIIHAQIDRAKRGEPVCKGRIR